MIRELLHQLLYWWKYRKTFRKMRLPVVRRAFPSLFISDLCSVQPMREVPEMPSIYFEYLDEAHPKHGQIFTIRSKSSEHEPCGCCRNSNDYWHKLWDTDHWVYEQNLTPEEWKLKCMLL